MEKPAFEEYLGDGCYVSFMNGMIELYTSNGAHVTNRIFLEPEVMAAFLSWYERLRTVQLKREEQHED